jgi:hypothetical protein
MILKSADNGVDEGSSLRFSLLASPDSDGLENLGDRFESTIEMYL